MKIAILTQPLHNNYGGLLQAYALQKVLLNMGHEVLVVDFYYARKFYSGWKDALTYFVGKYILRRKNILLPRRIKNEIEIISHHTNRFIVENIKTTENKSKTGMFEVLGQKPQR